MKFRTEINPPPSAEKIKHTEKIVTFGSCFADNIADKLIYYKFNVLKNPFGVLYNPASIANSLQILFNNKVFAKKDLIYRNGEFHSFYHHSDFSHHDAEVCLGKINNASTKARAFIEEASIAILTFGTAFVYKHIERNIIVSNCHKIPQQEFARYRLSPDETTKEIARAVKYLKLLNKNIRVIVTVSPVRHWKDGAVENQRSKATLILATEKIIEEYASIEYFPSYEIVIDDLRDYRFYDEDLLHPNSLAVNYIWEKFSDTYFDPNTKTLLAKIEKIQKGLNHKPRNPFSEAHKTFLKKLNSEIDEIRNLYPHIDFDTRNNG